MFGLKRERRKIKEMEGKGERERAGRRWRGKVIGPIVGFCLRAKMLLLNVTRFSIMFRKRKRKWSGEEKGREKKVDSRKKRDMEDCMGRIGT